MNYDKQRVFGHEFARKLAEALYAECPNVSPRLFSKIAKSVGMDGTQAETFAALHRGGEPVVPMGFVETLRQVANWIESGKKHARKK